MSEHREQPSRAAQSVTISSSGMHLDLPVHDGPGPLPAWLREAMRLLVLGRLEIIPEDATDRDPRFLFAADVEGQVFAWKVEEPVRWTLVSVYSVDAALP